MFIFHTKHLFFSIISSCKTSPNALELFWVLNILSSIAEIFAKIYYKEQIYISLLKVQILKYHLHKGLMTSRCITLKVEIRGMLVKQLQYTLVLALVYYSKILHKKFVILIYNKYNNFNIKFYNSDIFLRIFYLLYNTLLATKF